MGSDLRKLEKKITRNLAYKDERCPFTEGEGPGSCFKGGRGKCI